jgi:hypothetical protein
MRRYDQESIGPIPALHVTRWQMTVLTVALPDGQASTGTN